jgi:hypothetical protein
MKYSVHLFTLNRHDADWTEIFDNAVEAQIAIDRAGYFRSRSRVNLLRLDYVAVLERVEEVPEGK